MGDGILKGITWEVERGAALMLRLEADPAIWGGLVPWQLRMMQEQPHGRLLPAAAGEEDGRVVLHYELADRRRLVQRLYADPPNGRQAVELAHRLVRTVADCKTCMLLETGFVLQEDFVYAARDWTDFKLCYLPLEGALDGRAMPPVSESLRLLLLRLFGFVGEPLPAGLAPVLGLLSQEPYSVVQLEQALRKARYGGIGREEEGRGAERLRRARGEARLREAGRIAGWAAKLSGWLPIRQGRREPLPAGPPSGRPPGGASAAADKTGLLVSPAGTGSGAGAGRPALLITCGSQTVTKVPEGDRFLIGRSAGSVDHAIDREDVSRLHCELVRTEEGWTATDLGSLNGTFLNGEPMLPYKPYPYQPGDVLQITGTTIRWADAAAGGVPAHLPAIGPPSVRQAGKKKPAG